MPRKKAVKKIPVKSAVKRPVVAEYNTPPAPIDSNKKLSRNRLLLILVGALILTGLVYAYQKFFVAVKVNGQTISRLAVINELEKQGGNQILDKMVNEALIAQEAHKNNITVSQKEIDTELKKIEQNLSQSGQTLDQVLQIQGLTKQQLVDQIRKQVEIEKLIGRNLSVSDKEIDDYIASNEASFPEGTDPQSLRNDIKSQLMNQKLNQKYQTWLEDLKKKSSIKYYIKY